MKITILISTFFLPQFDTRLKLLPNLTVLTEEYQGPRETASAERGCIGRAFGMVAVPNVRYRGSAKYSVSVDH